MYCEEFNYLLTRAPSPSSEFIHRMNERGQIGVTGGVEGGGGGGLEWDVETGRGCVGLKRV